MLQFWKRSGQKEKTRSSANLENCSFNQHESLSRDQTCLQVAGLDSVTETEACNETFIDTSKLSKSLLEVLQDKDALVYFLHFLESENASAYARCWLDIENFKESARCSSLVAVNSSTCSSRLDHDSLSISTDCDSITADSNSLNDFPLDKACEAGKPPKLLATSQRVNSVESNDASEGISSSLSDFSKTNSTLTGIDETAGKKATNNSSGREMLVNDSVNIYKKYIAKDALYPVGCEDDARGRVVEAICAADGMPDVRCFDATQKFVQDQLEARYFERFTRSSYFFKYQIDVLTSGSLVLEDVLYNETALFYFMEYLEQEGQRHLLEFWLAATSYRKHHAAQTNFDPVEARGDAVVLYDKYFSPSAAAPLGFSPSVRSKIQESTSADGPISPACFNGALLAVERHLRSTFAYFLQSQLFFRYLSELISTVQSSFCSQPPPRSSCASSSESCESTASSSRSSNAKKKRSAIRIENEQLYDPDSLWRRKHQDATLRFGRVDSYGKFRSEVEGAGEGVAPLKGKFAKMLRDLVNKEDRVREEMAWKVAEMIVRDVTSVTLSQEPDSF